MKLSTENLVNHNFTYLSNANQRIIVPELFLMSQIPSRAMQKKFLTGSSAFFSCLADFQPKDKDWIVLDDAPKGYKHYRQTSTPGKCVFEWRAASADELIAYALDHPMPAMQMIKFLTPDFAAHIGLTIGQLQRLKPLVDALDPKHRYASIIYESYIENGNFTLTDSQLDAAYRCYREARRNG